MTNPITALRIDWYILGRMLMIPSIASLMFSNPGMYDPFVGLAQASRLPVSQMLKGTTPSHTSPSNLFRNSSKMFRSFGLGIGVG
ncbi:MAG: hypothetical protein EZS28_010822 [Streblomastix strix]|uniref:Uncharacterized protein n=1 Tax=Streblomastix strix TaxID=222440 RepID=A0A5J4WF92_9EUKA|nr:MAG: hypothetical protein EZS28_010822 [Streblomastix strix]